MASDKNYELMLKINAAPAETGSRRFKGALNSIINAVEKLERNTDGSFANIKKVLNSAPKGKPATATALEQTAKSAQSASTSVTSAAEKLQARIESMTMQGQRDIMKLQASFATLGDDLGTSGIDQSTSALTRFRAAVDAAQTGGDLTGAGASFRTDIAELDTLQRAYKDVQAAKTRFSAVGDTTASAGGLETVTAALDRYKAAMDSATTSADRFEAAAQFRVDASGLVSSATAMQKADQAATKLSASIQSATVTAEGQLDKIRSSFEALGSTSGIRKAEAALQRYTTALNRAGSAAEAAKAKSQFRADVSGLKANVRELEATAKAQTEAATAAALHDKELEALARKWDPIRAASLRYADSLEEIARAEEAGILSSQRAELARVRAAAQLEDGAVAIGKYGQALKVNTFHVTNFSNQIADIIVTAPNQNLFTVMSQQGFQLASVMQTLGSRAAILQTLKAAFTSLVNPMTLGAFAIAGLTAGAVKLTASLFKTEEETKKTKDRLAELSAAIDGLGSVSQASAAQIATYLGQTFKSVSSDVQDLIDDLRQAEFGVLSHRIQREVETSAKELTRLGGAFDVFWADIQNPGQVDAGYLADMQKIIAASEMTYGEFQKLEKLTQDVFSAASVTDFISSLSQARSYAAELGGPVGDAVAKALLEAAKEGGVLNRVMGEANGATVDWNSSLGGVLQTVDAIKSSLSNISGTAIGNAAKVSELEALQAGKSIEEAARARDRAQKEIEWNGRLQGANIFERGAVAIEKAQYNAGVDLDRQIEAAREAARAAGRASTGGGAGASTTTNEIRAMADQLERQRLSLDAVRSGLFDTSTAADLYADALIKGDGLVSELLPISWTGSGVN